MKIPAFLLAAALALAGCAPAPAAAPAASPAPPVSAAEPAPSPAPDTAESAAPEDPGRQPVEWDFLDFSGEKIDFTFEDVRGFDLSYCVGWTLDDTRYRRIRVGDEVGGCRVNSLESRYLVAYYPRQGGRTEAICSRNEYTLDCGEPLNGVLAVSADGCTFHPYYRADGQNFWVLCENREVDIRDFEDRTWLATADGKRFRVQPVGIVVAEADGLVTEALAAEGYDAAALRKAGQTVYLDASIRFGGISFTPVSDGEGAGFWDTRGLGWLHAAEDVALGPVLGDAPPPFIDERAEAEPELGYLGDFDVKIVDKNGLPVANALVSSPLKETYSPAPDWRSDGDGLARVRHIVGNERGRGLFDYGDEREFTVTVPMPEGMEDVKQRYAVTLAKEALDAGIVFRLDGYDAAAELPAEPALTITAVYENGSPANNLLITLTPKSKHAESEPDSGGSSFWPQRYTNRDGKALFYHLPAGEYAVSMRYAGGAEPGGTVTAGGGAQTVTVTAAGAGEAGPSGE